MNPDQTRLNLELQGALLRAAARPDERADGPAYGQDATDRETARQRIGPLTAAIADLDAKGKRLRQQIGIARRKAQVPDDAHRAKVLRVTKQRTQSTTDCTLPELRAILAEYHESDPSTAPRRRPHAPAPAALERAPMLRRVEQLLAAQSLPWTYAEAIVRRQRGILDKTIDCPLDLVTDRELRALIAALARRQTRQGAPRHDRR